MKTQVGFVVSTQVKRNNQSGIILVSTLYLLIALLALAGAFFITTSQETGSYKGSRQSLVGFYAAESGLNVRADEIRQIFVGYNKPSGTSPTGDTPCQGGDNGSGDFACVSYSFNNRNVTSFIEEAPDNPIITTIPAGELYQNLNAQEYRYTVKSSAIGPSGQPEAMLELRFKSRLVPLFQFVAFYDKDLEILPGPTMNLSGPVHTNGDLYLQSHDVLSIDGQVTAAGIIYRGRKDDASCDSNSVRIMDPDDYVHLIPSCSGRTAATDSDVAAFNGMVQFDVDSLTVPEPEALDANAGAIYWDLADLRLVLALTGSGNIDTSNSPTGVEVRNPDGSLDASKTTLIHSAGCSGEIGGRAIGSSQSMYNNRENLQIKMLEVDLRNFLKCLADQSILTLSDDSEGGLIFHLSVDGPNSGAASNEYGVRVRNAAELQSTNAAHPDVRGMTLVSDQAFYTYGDFNKDNWIPAAILADAFNVLSRNWNDPPTNSSNSGPGCPGSGVRCSKNTNSGNNSVSTSNRVATDTTVYAAVLSGTDSTGGIEGAGGQGGAYNGGLENYPRFHEYWSGRTFTYLGSFVSLSTPRHSDGEWIYGGRYYTAPQRIWDYDLRFNDAANLPPLTPRFVYLRQELFVRDFEQ
ncbi:MAG: hypothetical protein KDD42_02995 [Bdellovibrionales bacterium]|nr:hypothetical protein [Bdellovibrionales bacterium]